LGAEEVPWDYAKAMDDNIRYVKGIIQRERQMLPAEDLVRMMLGRYPKLQLLAKKRKILDLGCGEGRNSVFLEEIGHEVFGVEVHQDIVEDLRGRYPRIEFKEGGNNSIPYPNGFFDLLISWQALYYLDNKRDSVLDNIFEMARCVSQGGTLIACVPFQSNFIYRDSKLIRVEEKFDIEYREIIDYFEQRTGSILACFPRIDSFIDALTFCGFTNHRIGVRKGDWFGLNYDWFYVVSDKVYQ
jgi:SAM-dependent methyltransferase